MLSLALLDIPALVPDVTLRLELCCTLEVSVGLSVQSWQLGFTASCLFWGWQHLLLLSAARVSGNIAPAAAT